MRTQLDLTRHATHLIVRPARIAGLQRTLGWAPWKFWCYYESTPYSHEVTRYNRVEGAHTIYFNGNHEGHYEEPSAFRRLGMLRPVK
jgi:hypothetical protein